MSDDGSNSAGVKSKADSSGADRQESSKDDRWEPESRGDESAAVARWRWDWKEGLRRRSVVDEFDVVVEGLSRAEFECRRRAEEAPNAL